MLRTVFSLILQSQVHYYSTKIVELVILCVCVFTVFKPVYYYDEYKCFVFYIVLECVLNHSAGCDVSGSKVG